MLLILDKLLKPVIMHGYRKLKDATYIWLPFETCGNDWAHREVKGFY